jgi:hypothetical protein
MSAAAAAATAGTEIRVRGELRGNAQLTLVGTAAAPIWITGEAGARLRGEETAALRLTSSRYLVVQNLELVEGPDHVLHFDACESIVLRNLHIHRAREACLKVSQSANVYVEDCDLHGAGELPGGDEFAQQVLDFVGVNGGHIVRSRIHDGPQVMVMLKGGTSDLLFAYNEVYGQRASGDAAVQVGQWTTPEFFQPQNSDHEASRVAVYANFIHDLGGPFLAFQGAHDCIAAHNTLRASSGEQLVRYLPGSAGSASGRSGSRCERSRFTGNVIVGGVADGASLNADADSLGEGNAVDHNVWFKTGALNWWSALPQESATSTYDQDPRLASDGTPLNTSLVDGRGPSDLASQPFAASFVCDYRGRSWSSPRDIGAISVP